MEWSLVTLTQGWLEEGREKGLEGGCLVLWVLVRLGLSEADIPDILNLNFEWLGIEVILNVTRSPHGHSEK